MKNISIQWRWYLDFESNDINQLFQAWFACPKKWRPKLSQINHIVAKRSVNIPVIEEEEVHDEVPDDFYLFW